MDANELANQPRQEAEAGLHEAAQSVTETAQEWTKKAKGTARDAGAAADLYLHEYAWTSLLLMTAVVGLVGYLLGARRR